MCVYTHILTYCILKNTGTSQLQAVNTYIQLPVFKILLYNYFSAQTLRQIKIMNKFLNVI